MTHPTTVSANTERGNMKPLCIYHGNCADGFTAAWAVWKRFGDEYDYQAGVYQEPPPDVTGRDVVLVDFSYKYDVLCAMSFKARSLLVLDHHKTAAEDLGRLPVVRSESDFHTEVRHICSMQNMPHIGALFDMDKSGAGLAWDFYHPDTKRPNLIDYVEDRDLWRFKLPLSREVNAFIFSYDYSFRNWDFLNAAMHDHMGVQNVADQGGAIERKHHKDVAELVKATKRDMVIGCHRVPVANLPYTLTSDAGHLMCSQWNGDMMQDGVTAQLPPFAACYWDTPEGRVFSLRSLPDGADVSEIAKQYGGGGHKNASGFRLPHGVDP